MEREVGKLVKTAFEIASYSMKSTLGVIFEADRKAAKALISEKIISSFLGKSISRKQSV